jgi:hypothetical protein
MSTLLKINVTNGQDNQNTFFFFQEPAKYSGGTKVFTNSLYHRTLQEKSKGGQITFLSNIQFYAAVQETNTAVPKVGDVSGYESASQMIDLAAKGNKPPNHDNTQMIYVKETQSLGLTVPENSEDVQEGAFRIRTATYQPPTYFNIGSATTVNGSIILSNFINGQPQTDVDCQPILKYYVQIGNYQPGVVMDFTTQSVKAALCDFTGGYTTANVAILANGDWKVDMS